MASVLYVRLLNTTTFYSLPIRFQCYSYNIKDYSMWCLHARCHLSTMLLILSMIIQSSEIPVPLRVVVIYSYRDSMLNSNSNSHTFKVNQATCVCYPHCSLHAVLNNC